MIVSEKMFKHIENALGIKLYQSQKDYLLSESYLPPVGDRQTGKTMAYCIKLALSNGVPLNMNKPEEFSDGFELGGHKEKYARNHFRHEFLKIHDALKQYGLSVRDIEHYKKSSLTYSIKDDADICQHDWEFLRSAEKVYDRGEEKKVRDRLQIDTFYCRKCLDYHTKEIKRWGSEYGRIE